MATRKTSNSEPIERRKRGFEAAGRLVRTQVRVAGESRGFAVSELLTRWADIVGEELAASALPVRVGYGKQGFGATLTILTTGAQAPLVDMQREQIREKVNAVYGYAAISAVRVTQTAATGFAEGQVAFQPAAPTKPAPVPQVVREEAQSTVSDVTDTELRRALEALATNVLSRTKR